MARIEIRGEARGPLADRFGEVLGEEALAFLGELHGRFEPATPGPAAGTRRAPARLAARRDARLPRRDARGARGRLAGRPGPRRPRRPAGRDHRPDRPQDGDQRAELGRQGLHGRLRGLELAAVGEHDRRPGQPLDAIDGTIEFTTPEEGVPAPRRRGDAARPAARLAPAREAPAGRRQPVSRRALRLRPLPLPQRPQADRAGTGPYFYLPKMESHLEARLWNDVFEFSEDGSGSRPGRSRRRC